MSSPVRAKKHLGQHFLRDQNIAMKIAGALLDKDNSTPIIEVGPGMGVLTTHLVGKSKQLIAIDIDRESIAFLGKEFSADQLKIIEGNFLEMDLNSIAGERFNIIGNFPYNISSQIMFKLLDNKDRVQYLVGMFQKEVAQRIAEKPGTKTYGILSVLLQAWYDIEYLFTVHEHSFDPPPKVKSAVIRLTRNATTELGCDQALFKSVVKTTFNQRRKTIRNSLKPLLQGKTIDHPLLDKRPERLSVEEFVELTVAVEKSQKS
jgi:16S rRNA (adenine1518-N6/adenine1519-N6)-dimethyltransferase